MTTERHSGTYPLDELGDYRVAESDTDPRGWDVTSADNLNVGRVKELLVDLEQMKVRYLAVELDVEQSGSADRCILIPIGTARMVDDDDRVIVRLSASAVRALPGYTLGGRLEREHEELALSGVPHRSDWSSPSFYDREEFDSEKFYGSRYMGDSDARARKGTGVPIDDRIESMTGRDDGHLRSERGTTSEDRPMR